MAASPEFRLLLACLRTQEPPETASLPLETIRSERFLALVRHHHVAPLVHSRLRTTALSCLPASVQQSLEEQVRRNRLRAMAMAEELVRLAQGFAAANLPVLALKGPPLAVSLYGDLARRHAGDLDLLIASEDREQAANLLARSGYRPLDRRDGLTPKQQAAIQRKIHHAAFQHEQKPVLLELHTRFTNNSHLFPLDFTTCLARAQTVEIAGCPIPVLSRSDLALYLLVHGAKHGWYRLFWLVDVAQMAVGKAAPDWPGLMAQAETLGVQRMVAQGVELAGGLLGLEVPACVRDRAARDRVITHLVREACRAITQTRGAGPHGAEMVRFVLRYALRLRPDPGYKMRELECLLTHSGDYEAVRLPDALFPLYYALRPLLWLARRKAA